MNRPLESLEIATAPFVHRGRTTTGIMFEVLAVVVAVVVAATYFFGLTALLVVAAATLGAVSTEWAVHPDRLGWGPLRNGSALLTGVLLGLTLPPGLPLWMAFLGGVIGIGLGKLIWGGLGGNLFNPALVGRAFLQAAFPAALTTWTAPGGSFMSLPTGVLAMPLMGPGPDVVSAASPLGMIKFEGKTTEWTDLLLGNTSGCLGETCGLLLVLCGLWLGVRRLFDWRLPVATVTAVAVFGGLLHLANPRAYPDPLFLIFSGGLLFAAVFMVTDPVTTPVTRRGAWIFGAGVGFLVVLIRLFGGLPEGVMYAVLLMNSVTPLINRYTQPRPFGG